MQTNIERVVTMIRALPLEDLDRLGEIINEEKRAKHGKNERLRQELEDYAKAKKWIDAHGEEYMNQWVCLEGDRLVAHSADGRDVYRKARESGIKAPFIHYVEKESEAFWGGWL